jgi:type III secretion protein V
MNAVSHVLCALRRHPELFVVAFMVAIVGTLVVPLPPALLDLLLVANLGLSLTLLVSALHLRGPLALSTFPTLLLVATLFRLALNVSSTRLILGEGSAGKVIAAFGEFVVGGSYLVGAVVFVIVLLVQFLVVAKGAERVAEVGARFTLDALPGKQMAIDADLRAGACTQEEAGMRRKNLERESQFYGALDGAMKFVKGDAIAGLLITAINVVGGLAVGAVVHGMPMGEAAATFTLLSIGDGLVSQVPALLTAVAAGLVVTRGGSDGERRLGADVVTQLAAQPRAIVASGIVLAAMGLVPGLPAAPFLGLGLCAAAGGALRLRRGELAPVAEGSGDLEPPVGRPAGGADADGPRGPLRVVIDADVSEAVAAGLAEGRLEDARVRLFGELGLPIPPIRLDRSRRPGHGFQVLLHDVPLQQGHVAGGPTLDASMEEARLLGLHAAQAGGEAKREAPGEETAREGTADDAGADDPPRRIVLDEADAARAAEAGLPVARPEDAVVTAVLQVARVNAADLLGLETVQGFLDALEARAPALVREATRRVPIPLLFEVLVRLLDEGVSIEPLDRILEALARWGEASEGPASAAALTERARQALGRRLVHRHAAGGPLVAVLVDPLVEDLMRESRIETAEGPVVALAPEHQSALLDAMRRELDGGAVLLAPADLRRQLWGLAQSASPGAAVLAFSELPRDARVQPVARLAIADLDPLMLAQAA